MARNKYPGTCYCCGAYVYDINPNAVIHGDYQNARAAKENRFEIISISGGGAGH